MSSEHKPHSRRILDATMEVGGEWWVSLGDYERLEEQLETLRADLYAVWDNPRIAHPDEWFYDIAEKYGWALDGSNPATSSAPGVSGFPEATERHRGDAPGSVTPGEPGAEESCPAINPDCLQGEADCRCRWYGSDAHVPARGPLDKDSTGDGAEPHHRAEFYPATKTHGRFCDCTPCKAEDWEQIERDIREAHAPAKERRDTSYQAAIAPWLERAEQNQESRGD